MTAKLTGPANPRWRGGTYTTHHGYQARKVPHGGFGAGYQYEHRLIAETMLGRPLTAYDRAADIDGISWDVFADAMMDGGWAPVEYQPRWLLYCQAHDIPDPTHVDNAAYMAWVHARAMEYLAHVHADVISDQDHFTKWLRQQVETQ